MSETCDKCGKACESVDEYWECDECALKAQERRQEALWERQEQEYDIAREREDQDLRDAGRGHLIRP